MDMPFGFGGGVQRRKNTTQQASLTPQQRRQNSTQQLTRQVQFGLDSGDPMGAIMGFAGLPYWARGGGNDSTPHGSGPAPWQQIWPGGVDPNMGGMGGGNGGGGGNPQIENPPLPPFDPNNHNGNGNQDYAQLLQLMYPPPIGTGAQWRNTMKYGA